MRLRCYTISPNRRAFETLDFLDDHLYLLWKLIREPDPHDFLPTVCDAIRLPVTYCLEATREILVTVSNGNQWQKSSNKTKIVFQRVLRWIEQFSDYEHTSSLVSAPLVETLEHTSLRLLQSSDVSWDKASRLCYKSLEKLRRGCLQRAGDQLNSRPSENEAYTPTDHPSQEVSDPMLPSFDTENRWLTLTSLPH